MAGSFVDLRQVVANIYHWAVSVFFTILNGYPAQKMKVIGVTGTDGKTTTSHLIFDILRSGGIKTGLISTIGAFVGQEEIDTGLHTTTPDARLLQPILRRMRQDGVTHVVLEVTSHGLDQNRLVGCNFYIGVITNITHEHLDYHRTFERYREAKAKLISNTQYSVLNKNDPNFAYLKSKSRGQVIPYAKTKIKITNPRLVGEYNQYNVGAAVAVARIFKIADSIINKAITDFTGVPGRMEEIKWPEARLPAGRFRVIIDFAHTPNALEQVLRELKTQKSKLKKLILVFGCAGLRDHTKRPLIGKIAVKFADKVIITAEDPRTESLDEIYKQITSTMGGEVFREDDRQKAINLAVSLAKPGDIVIVTGKGHEKSMCFGTTEFPWSDREAVEKAIHTNF